MTRSLNNPLDDTIVHTWDVFLSGEAPGSPPVDESVHLVISEFTRMFDAIGADEQFLSNLELHLFGFGSVVDTSSAVEIATTIAPPLLIPPVTPTPTGRRPTVRDLVNLFSMAALVAITLAGIAVIYFAGRNSEQPASGLPTAIETPITVNRESYVVLLDSAVDGRSLYPNGAPPWDEAYFAALLLEPGASISTDNPTIRCCNGLHVITVVTGELSVEMSQLISVNQADGTVLVSVGSVTLKPGDSAIYQGEMTAHNPKNSPVRFLVGGAFTSSSEPVAAEPTSGLTVISEVTTPITFDPGATLSSLDIDQITLGYQFHVVQLDITPNDVMLVVASGGEMELGTSQTDPSPIEISNAASLGDFEPGSYWMNSTSPRPVLVYILRFGPDLVSTQPE